MSSTAEELDLLLRQWERESWATVFVYFYEPDKTGLILDAVRPLFAQLAALTPRHYFVRHWRFGPHLRLRFGTDPTTFTERVLPRVQEVLLGQLDRAPSRAVVDAGDLLRQHRRLAQLESERGSLLPYRRDNTIEATAGGPLGSDPEDERIQRLLADYYVDSNEHVFESMTAIRTGRTSRYDLAAELMIAVAHTMYPSPREPGITEGFVSFRSHAEAYLAMVPERAAVRRHFDGQYERVRSALVSRVRARVAGFDAGRPPDPLVDSWLALARPHAIQARELVAAGRLVLPFPHREGTGMIGWDDPWVDHSRFHTLINGSEMYLKLLFETLWFQQYRMALNLMYLHLNRIGLLPVERYLLCHLVANAVEEAFG
ncbi:MAG: hypothetical protein JWR85_1635, partial [Marmoricola sp.]|nr:hypothetical protein [Marmoricola sp.]